ncbi:MAG: DUF86 domain-containing protein [Oscillospiraceae bacterium]|nr:DUF86 domain-containing protein [Oscillospiraceae bacterium]
MKIVQHADEIGETISRFELDLEKFKNDSVMKNAIAMCILQIGELVNNLTDDFKTTYPEMPWRDIIAMRNRAVHAYSNIDFEILWIIATSNVPELKAYCESIIKEKKSE